MADLGEVHALLDQASQHAADGHRLVATAQEQLEAVAQQLASMGVADRAAVTRAAVESAQQATGALAQAAQDVQNAIAAAHQAATGGG